MGARDPSKRLKIIPFFARPYLGNRKSDRDKPKYILKGKVPCFQWFFIRSLKVNIFGNIKV